MQMNGSEKRRWRREVGRTHDFTRILQHAGESPNLDTLVTEGFFPMLQALVVRNTVSSPLESENVPTAGRVHNAGLSELAIANKIAQATEALGIETHIVPITDPNITGKFGPQAAVICRIGPKNGKTGLMLAGHMDTVGAQPEKWVERNPFHLRVDDEGRIHGRGVADMKSADAAMLNTLALMKAHEAEMEKDFVMVLTPGEESWTGGSKAASAKLNELGIEPGLVVVGEPDPASRIGIGHPGFLGMDVPVAAERWSNKGRDSIAALANTITALDGFAEKLKTDPEFRSEGFDPEFTALNYAIYAAHNFEGTNSVPAEAHLDITCHDASAVERLREAANGLEQEMVDEEGPGEKRITGIDIPGNILLGEPFRVTVHGKAAHSWDPRLGVNSWKYWAKLVERIAGDDAVTLTFPEEEYGVSPKFAVSYRCPEERLEQRVWKGVMWALNDNGLRMQTPEITDNEPAMPLSSNGNPVLKKARDIIGKVIGGEASVAPSTGWGEGAYYAGLRNSPAVFYWFPHEEETSHQANEFVTFSDMMKGLRGYLAMAGEFCGVTKLKEMADSPLTVTPADIAAKLERGGRG